MTPASRKDGPKRAGARGAAKGSGAKGAGSRGRRATAGSGGSSSRIVPPEPARRRQNRGSDELGGDQVEGRQAVLELLRAGRRPVHQVLVAEGADADGPLAEIVALAERRGVTVRTVGRSRISAAAGTEAPQGVVASADPVQPVGLDDLARRPGPEGAPPLIVVLDGVTDPHNLGAIMRSAVGAGASGIVIGRHRAARLTPAAVKAAAGAVEHLPVSVAVGIPAALRELAGAGVWTVGLDADAATGLWDLRVATEGVAVVLGAEGRGLARLTRDVCELTVSIPLAGPLGSLNVSAAAALACFEVARGRARA